MNRNALIPTGAIALSCLLAAFNCPAQGTAFTYQGRLNDGAGPANGTYDLRFAIYDSATGGTQQGNALTNATTAVSNGLFTVTLDFGNQFPGAGRWLELGARTNGGSSFSTLSPRQPLTASPYAIYAAGVNASGIAGPIADNQLSANIARLNGNQAFTGAVQFNNSSNIFTGAFSGAFSGNGLGLTNADLSRLSSGAITWGSFLPASTPGVGRSPVFVVAVDVNGDGKPDLISANSGTNTLTVLTNNGKGSFTLASSPTVGNGPFYIAATDLNGDGRLDLAAANFNASTVTVLTNGGAGGFGLVSSFAVGSGPYSVAFADVNGDGKMDIVTANYFDSTLTILTNNGAGSFALAASPAVGGNPSKVLAIDVNGDGKVDLVSANRFGNSLSVLTNNGSGRFTLACTVPDSTLPISLAAMDVNGDGKVDLISGNPGSGTLVVFTNAGNGIFSFASSLGSGAPQNLVVADVYGDGRMELISADDGLNSLTIYTNNGGTLVAAATLPVGVDAEGLAAADLNGDGKLDLVSANAGDNTLTVLLNSTLFTGSGAGLSSLSAGNISSGVLADARLSTNIARLNSNAVFTGTVVFNNAADSFSGTFSGNGAGIANVNLVNANTAGAINWFSNFTGNFSLWGNLSVGSEPEAIIAADVNGDGRTDLVTANFNDNTLTIIINGGSGYSWTNLNVGANPTALAAADLNSDGYVDLVCANYGGGTLTILTNSGNGFFTVASSPVVGSNPSSIAAGDFNGDGRVDLAVLNGPDVVTIMTNAGNGIFGISSTPATGHNPSVVIAADINGDGRLDLICANYGTNTLTILTNNGSGGFALAGMPTVGTAPNSVRAADVNGDGRLDLICGSLFNGGKLVILTNNGSGQFSVASTPPVSGETFFLAVADVNTDGKPDIINVNFFTNTIDILTNNGSGSFVPASVLHVGTGPAAVETADLNGDRGVDLIIADPHPNNVFVLLNTPDTNRPLIANFHGDGSALGNLSLAQNANVAVLNSNQTFTAANNFINPANTFSGNGAGLAGLSAGNIASGTLPDARLSANVALLNAGQTFTGQSTFNNPLNSFTGNGSGLTSLTAGNLTGTVLDARLSPNIPLLNANQTFTGTNIFNNANVGIGTNSPTQLLQLNVTAGHGEGMEIDSANPGHTPAIYLNHTGANGHLFRIASYGDNTSVGSFRIRDDTPGINADRLTVDANGVIGVSNAIAFGAQTRQMLNLWGTQYGIGVQSFTMYFRADSGAGFSWFRGGVHSDFQNNPGIGGTEMMRLDSSGTLSVRGVVATNVNLTSDRAAKEHFNPIDSQRLLDKVASLPVSEWNFKTEPGIQHIGPMAQDFYAAFHLGDDDKHIAVVDEGGVALAAIQGLKQRVEAENAELRSENRQLKQRIERLENMLLNRR